MVAVASSIVLSRDVIQEIESAAAEFDKPTDDVVRAAIRRYVLAERRWRELGRIGAERAEALGLRTEDDVEAFIDSLPE